MKILFYSAKTIERSYLEEANNNRHQLEFTDKALSDQTASLANGFDVISIFTNDDASADVILLLHKAGVKYITIRSASYDNTDIEEANNAGILVANVPESSTYAVAEHTVALMLALNRKIIQAQAQVHHYNFTLDNLVGSDLFKKKVGIIGTGRIGSAVARILHGFGCMILAHDVVRNQHLQSRYNVYYLELATLCSMADIITIHLPLTPQTQNIMDHRLISRMKAGVMLINTARGALVKTEDVVDGLESGQIGSYGADVYENEKELFFYDHSKSKVEDTVLSRLNNLSNVLLTPHQAFATREALTSLAVTTFHNIDYWTNMMVSENELTYRRPSER